MDENKTTAPEENGKNNIHIGVIEKTPQKMLEELDKGFLVAARVESEMLYVVERYNTYHCFIHPLGSADARQRRMDKNDENVELLTGITKQVSEMYSVEFPSDFDLYGVLYATEEAIVQLLEDAGKLKDLSAPKDGLIDFSDYKGKPQEEEQAETKE